MCEHVTNRLGLQRKEEDFGNVCDRLGVAICVEGCESLFPCSALCMCVVVYMSLRYICVVYVSHYIFFKYVIYYCVCWVCAYATAYHMEVRG